MKEHAKIKKHHPPVKPTHQGHHQDADLSKQKTDKKESAGFKRTGADAHPM